MVIGRCCGRRRVDAERLREAPNTFFIVHGCPGSVGEGAACCGRASSCPAPWHAGERHAASVSGVVSPPRRSAGEARRPARNMLKAREASFPLSGFAAQSRAGGMPYPVPAGRVKIAAAQAFALADERRFACPVRRNIALCLRQHRSGAGPAKAAAPEFKPLVLVWRQMRQEPQRALPSGAAFSASMFDHEKKGEDRTSSPLVVMTDYRTLKS